MKKILIKLLAVAVAVTVASESFAVQWDVSLWGQRRAFTEHIEKLAELLAEKTNGEFTLNISYGGLSNNRENLDGISIGAFEMAQFCAGYHEDKNPTITVLELPFLGVQNLEQEVAVSHAVYSHPATVADLARWNAKLLMTSPMPQYNIAGVGEPRDSVESFRGMRVRATGGLGEAFKSVGAVPTSVTASEAQQAMQNDLVDTVAFAQHAHLSFKTIDLASWWTENLNPGTVNCPVVVNIDAYNDLSNDHRAALDGSIDEAIEHYLENYGNLLDQWEQILVEKNVQKVSISDAELAKFRDASSGISASWIEKMSAQGIPAQELYDLVQGTLADLQ